MADTKSYLMLIDGYNVIKRHPGWCHLPLPEARARLLAAVRQMRWAVPVSAIRVVYDSHQAVEGDPTRYEGYASGHVRIEFASPSADEAIRQTIRIQTRPEDVMVISDDREIMGTAKSHGAVRLTVAWFLQHVATPRLGPRPASTSLGTGRPGGSTGRGRARFGVDPVNIAEPEAGGMTRRGRMRGGRVVGLVVIGLVVGVPQATAWAQDPIHKFGRGVGNVLTCWIELPKNFHLGMQEENPVLGAGWGLLVKGSGLAATRLVVGAYEAVSFLVPYPKDYASPYENLELSDYAWE